MKATYTMGMKPDGRELLVVVVKGTFNIPADPQEPPTLAAVQEDFVMADRFSGDPGFSAPVYESEFAPFKPRCDVLLNGSAYAPAGKPATRVQVGLRVGALRKTFDVIGDRVWRRDFLAVAPTPPAPFTVMPISYDRAFGGSDCSHEDPKRHDAWMENPVGRGFHVNDAKGAIDGRPLPNTEAVGSSVTNPKGSYRPMSFGPVGRGWQPRSNYAGTYDQRWIDDVFPFLPADFDEQYYQSSPEDQQLDKLEGGEEVVLLNLTPRGQTFFKVPSVRVPITIYLRNHEERQMQAVNDTLVIEPDLGRIILLWRTALPLKRNMFEVAQIVVGTMPRAWHRARISGKAWYPSLKHLVEEKRSDRSGEVGV